MSDLLPGFVKLSESGVEKTREISLELKSPHLALALRSNATDGPELYKSDIVVTHSIRVRPLRSTISPVLSRRPHFIVVLFACFLRTIRR